MDSTIFTPLNSQRDMDLSQVKMVVTDMDGTLLNSKSEVSKQFFKLFESLRQHDVHFVAASGRQYSSIQEKLDLIQDDITIIAENGGYIKQGDQELGSVHLSNEEIKKLVPILRKTEGIYTVLCGKKSAYIESKDEKFQTLLKEYYNIFDVVQDLLLVDSDEFFKVAVYHFESSEKFIYPLVEHLEDNLLIKISGTNWVDIADPKANKGKAVELLQKKHGISMDETMIFGDFNNDLEMISQGYFSYAMENAHPNVKKAARFNTKSNNQAGVEFILEKLISAKESLNK